jgi:undecaprenyl pyrophosphate synthase
MNTGCFGKSGRQAVPRHIRLILDGNRRYGQRQHLTELKMRCIWQAPTNSTIF